MKKITKDSFNSLQYSFPVLSEMALRVILGGSNNGGSNNDCVPSCFGFLDPLYSAKDYEGFCKKHYGYDVASSGVRTSDICGLGNCGNLKVSELNISGGISLSGMSSNGKLNGDFLMMLIPGSKDKYHAVIVTGAYSQTTNGVTKTYLRYKDPSNGYTDSIPLEQGVVLLYSISVQNSSSSTSVNQPGNSSGNATNSSGNSTSGYGDDAYSSWYSCGNSTSSGGSSSSSSSGSSSGSSWDYWDNYSSSSGNGTYYA